MLTSRWSRLLLFVTPALSWRSFPSFALSGYPPEDLVLREDFLVAAGRQLERVAAAANDIVVAIGFPMAHPEGVANALAVLADGEIVTTYRKQLLPNYGVFDERRYFVPGDHSGLIVADGIPIGMYRSAKTCG